MDAETGTGPVTDRIWTVPNLLSFARLLGVPLFLWLVLTGHDWWALGVLVFAGLSDWLDGKLARALNQTSKLGAVLDPAADRLYILATLVGLTVRDVIPLWLVVVLLAREVAITPIVPIMRRLGYAGTLPVHFVGKAGTMCLLYAFPLLLVGDHHGWWATTARVGGWAFAIWGVALYWWAAALYWAQTLQLARADHATPPDQDAAPHHDAEPDHDAAGQADDAAPAAAPRPTPDRDPSDDQKGADTPR
ncbi:CDP-alcohol phosphatidyltransferase family protein [Actinomadura harenae]|uniref:CDP-alcohol phosphatidyltransferase family protein n=1 Tax=Actinomadura harenae TaxID=2483351 RepID=A0A3M2LKR9_9ACTN|nr:CDP-alcohol phosphatidyltransferase family protein [Actinomadura harenae]RMI37716.1 CDP-alcohol phosphatidyltransferase family protein [Actinomadura harenae]